MTSLRIVALIALVGAAPLAARASSLDLNPAAPAAASSGMNAAQTGTLDLSGGTSSRPETASIYTSGPVPIGDSRWAYRSFSLAGESMQEAAQVEPVDEEATPTPEPAGLFLLGSGAFVTALSIRYRLFSL